MENAQSVTNCIYNILYTQFNEDFGRDNFFSYNLMYPTFYNFKNGYFFVDLNILNNLNSTINSDVYTFKTGLLKEEQDYNNSAVKNALPKRNYKVLSNYAVTFNKNHIISIILSLMGFAGDYGPKYNYLYNYNIDLLSGNKITLKDVFIEKIDYIKVVSDYINYKISQNKDMYYKNTIVEISEDQAFYITDDGIIVYFDVDEIAPEEFGIPKFKIAFNKFAPYINPRFSCLAQNVFRKYHKKSHSRKY